MDNLQIEKKQSRLGIASFVISVTVGVLIFITVLLAGVLHNAHPRGVYPGQNLVGLFIIFLVFVDIGAVSLGIASLFEKDRKRVLGILGLVFSGLSIIFTIGLCVLGLAMAGKF